MMRLVLALPVLLASPAAALTPEELWESWRAGVAGFGGALTGEAVPGGDGSLTLRGLTVEAGNGPEPVLPPGFPVQEVVLRPAAGGAVEIDLGLGASTRFDDGTDLTVLEQDGLAITARDGADGVDYEVAAGSLRMALLPGPDSFSGSFGLEVSNLRASGGGGLGAGQAVALEVALDGYAYLTGSPQGDIDAGFGSGTAARGTGPMTLTASLTMPASLGLLHIASPSDFARAVGDGLAFRMELATGDLRSSSWAQGFPFAYQAESTSSPGRYAVSADRAAASLVAEYGAGATTVTAPGLPFETLDLGYDRLAAEFRVPLTAEPGDLRTMIALEGVTANEEAWAFIDPSGTLPREPARLVVDVGGRMAVDLPAILAAEATGAMPPVPTLESLEIRAFEVAGAGLSATGTGSFDVARTDPATGLPVPVGQAQLRLDGLDRLVDALVAMGALPPDIAAGLRAGAGAYFRPVSADARETTLDAQADGTVRINGLVVQ